MNTNRSLIAISFVFVSFQLFHLNLIKNDGSNNPIHSTPLNNVSFPIDFYPRSKMHAPEDHTNIMENKDGLFRENKCETWSHDKAFACNIEWDEWMMANAFVQPGDVVIEFGARYGTTSCVLSRNVGVDGHVISVEPDVTVHGHLLRNRHYHFCNFHAVLGTVSDDELYYGNSGYAGQTSSSGAGLVLPRVSRTTIESLIKKRINVALIDCEGCIPHVEKTGLLSASSGVDIILLEEDIIKYTEWHETLVQNGYRCHWYLKDTFINSHPGSGWSIHLRHSAWVHSRVEGMGRVVPPPCQEYVSLQGLNSSAIDCSVCPV